MRRAFLVVLVALAVSALGGAAAGLGTSSDGIDARATRVGVNRAVAESTLRDDTLRVAPLRADTVTKALRHVATHAQLAVVTTVVLGTVASWWLGRARRLRTHAAFVCSGSSPRAPPLA
jgi:hypothetical protein